MRSLACKVAGRLEAEAAGEKIAGGDSEAPEAVDGAAAKIDGGRFGEVLGGAADFADHVAMPEGLRDELVVEDEIVGEPIELHFFEQRARIGAITGVIFRQLRSHQNVLRDSQEPIGDVLPPGHAAAQCEPTQDARSHHKIVELVRDHAGQGRYQLRSILIVGVDHNHDICAAFERQPVAGFLIATVAEIFVVHVHDDAGQRSRERDGAIATAVVDQDDIIHDALLEDLVVGRAKGEFCIVGGHDDRDAFVTIHGGSGGFS